MHTLLCDQILEKLQGFDCRGGVEVERLPRMREIRGSISGRDRLKS